MEDLDNVWRLQPGYETRQQRKRNDQPSNWIQRILTDVLAVVGAFIWLYLGCAVGYRFGTGKWPRPLRLHWNSETRCSWTDGIEYELCKFIWFNSECDADFPQCVEE